MSFAEVDNRIMVARGQKQLAFRGEREVNMYKDEVAR